RPVVHQRAVAGGEPPRQPAQNASRSGARRVETASRPGHVTQSAGGQHGIEERAPESGRSAEENRRAAGDRGNGRLRRIHFALQPGNSEKSKRKAVMVAMVLDAVAATR